MVLVFAVPQHGHLSTIAVAAHHLGVAATTRRLVWCILLIWCLLRCQAGAEGPGSSGPGERLVCCVCGDQRGLCGFQ